MTKSEVDIIGEKIDEVWGDWAKVFDIMIANDLYIEDANICNRQGYVVFEGITDEMYYDEIRDLICNYFLLYKSINNSEFEISRKNKYMKLC